MINPSFEELRKINDSRYAIVMITSKRAKRLVEKSKPLIETASQKPVTIALEELMQGKISYETTDLESIK
ncbi:DNA-directed RNA polymerase subunit omega [Microaceticoccus formicicus]|uniref:DNA-directed RNA polymerase subunit omega n=1 Tax=Microaceticoccus formicicus TaxID=3118105 RepID=UPI003CD00B11|nr:DNA-directed RNA polymerase subunit omega [Peptoniphilaceae bacterium AMB_02]